MTSVRKGGRRASRQDKNTDLSKTGVNEWPTEAIFPGHIFQREKKVQTLLHVNHNVTVSQ